MKKETAGSAEYKRVAVLRQKKDVGSRPKKGSLHVRLVPH